MSAAEPACEVCSRRDVLMYLLRGQWHCRACWRLHNPKGTR